MPTYIVYRKSDQTEVTQYTAASTAPKLAEYPLTDYDHLEVVPDEPDPVPKPREMTVLAFMRLLTQAERIAIRNQAKTTAALEDWLDLLKVAQEVSLDDPDTITALNWMESQGLLSAGRAAEILS